MSMIVIEERVPSSIAPTTRRGRWLAAGALVAGAALQVFELALSYLSDDNADRVSYWVAHPAQTGAAMTAGLVAVPLLLVGFVLTLAIAKPESRRLAVVAACFLTTAMVGLAGAYGLEMSAFSAAAGGDQVAAVSILDLDELVAPMIALLVMFVGGAIIGMVLLTVVLWRASRFPRVAALGAAAFAVLDVILGYLVAGHLVWLATSAVLGWSIVAGYVRPNAKPSR